MQLTSVQSHTRVYSGPSRTSDMELIAKVVNGLSPLTIFAMSSILDVRRGSEYTHRHSLYIIMINHYLPPTYQI